MTMFSYATRLEGEAKFRRAPQPSRQVRIRKFGEIPTTDPAFSLSINLRILLHRAEQRRRTKEAETEGRGLENRPRKWRVQASVPQDLETYS
ncbi:hypothetical protein DTO271D3_6758 [Paecilomyces variotii]|nr:hypothetical protein DTO271D3_6758 [Paecilomyces variotii]